MITTDTGEQYETKSHFLMGIKVPEEEDSKASTTSTRGSGGNRKPAGELKDDSGTQVAGMPQNPAATKWMMESEEKPSIEDLKDRELGIEMKQELGQSNDENQSLSASELEASNKPIAPTWRDLRPDTYVPTEGAPSQQPKPKPIPIKPDKLAMNTDHMPESENIEDRRQDPEMSKLELIARQSWDAYTKAWKKVMGTDENPKPQWIADEDVRKGRSIKPEHGAPGGPSGGSLTLNRHPEVSKDYFRIRDSEGKVVAGAHLSPTKDGKGVSVGAIFETINIAGRGDSLGTPNIIGTRAIRSLIPEVKRHFPDAEYIEGLRISGARPKATNAKVPIK